MKWFKEKIQAWKAQRKLIKQVDPRSIRTMAEDIRDLALLASQLSPKDQEIRDLIRNVVKEMERLVKLTDLPEFRKLSTGKRLLLRQGLIESREKLLESIESAPSPTNTIQ